MTEVGPSSRIVADAASIPVRTAATVLILAERPDLQVLMLKRNARSVFVGGMWVFPGGAVDPGDATSEADAAVEGRTDDECSRQLALEQGGIAYWVAALRETFEESGVLLARPIGGGSLVDFSDPALAGRFERHRAALNADERAFVDIVTSEGLSLDGAGTHYIARWITPIGPPRRYDTRFFVTAMPTGQVPLHDNDEAVHHEWVRASDALDAHRRGEMGLLTPTISMLQRLAAFASVDQAIAVAAGATAEADEQIRIRGWRSGPDRIAYPADHDYDRADPLTESGSLRWPLRS